MVSSSLCLTQRTAKKAIFKCHRCRGALSNNPPVLGKSRVNLGCGSALQGKHGSNPLPKSKKSGPCQVSLSHSHSQSISAPSTSTAQSSTIYSQPSRPLIPSHCHSVSLSQPLPLLPSDNQCPPSECSSSLPIVHSSVQTIDQCISEHTQESGVLSNSGSQPIHGCSDCISKAEVNAMFTKLESTIRASFNARLLALEEQVSELAQSVHMLKGRSKPTPSPSRLNSTRSRRRPPPSSRALPPSRQTSQSTNSRPFWVVWGTPRSCSSQVVLKAICALLPDAACASVIVKGSFRRRMSRDLWWYTIMAPVEVMQQIEATWHILEAKTSWSLRSSLSGHPNSQDVTLQHPSTLQESSTTAAILTPSSPSLISVDMACPASTLLGSSTTNAEETPSEVCPVNSTPSTSSSSSTNAEVIPSAMCPASTTISGSSDSGAEETSSEVLQATQSDDPTNTRSVYHPCTLLLLLPLSLRTLSTLPANLVLNVLLSLLPLFWMFSPVQWSLLEDHSASQCAFIPSVSLSEACWCFSVLIAKSSYT